MKLQNHLPAISQRMLPQEVLDLEFPNEQRSSCNACYQVAKGSYKADLKCCTVIPHVPNFLLGFALKDEKTVRNIEQAIRLGFVLPEGMQHTPQLFFRAMAMNRDNQLGLDYEMVCPFLKSSSEGTHCGIHAYRNANCSTYFCQSNFGRDGSDLWMDVRYLLRYGETHLSGLCLEAIGFDFNEFLQCMEDITTLDLSDTLDQAKRGYSLAAIRYIWGIDEGFSNLTDQEDIALANETTTEIKNRLISMADWLDKNSNWPRMIAESTFGRPNLAEFSEEPDYEDGKAGRYINYQEAIDLLKGTYSNVTSKFTMIGRMEKITLVPGYQIKSRNGPYKELWTHKLINSKRDVMLLTKKEYDIINQIIEKNLSYSKLSPSEKEWISLMLDKRFIFKSI